MSRVELGEVGSNTPSQVSASCRHMIGGSIPRTAGSERGLNGWGKSISGVGIR